MSTPSAGGRRAGDERPDDRRVRVPLAPEADLDLGLLPGLLRLALLWIAAAGGLFKDANISFGSGKVVVNSPYALAQTVAILGMFGITVMAAIMGRAVQQDVEYRTQLLLHRADRQARVPRRPLPRRARRAAGRLRQPRPRRLPRDPASRAWTPSGSGPNRWAAYLSPYASVLLPNVLVIGAIFFSLAALTQKMLPVYIGSVVVLIG